MKWEEFNKNRVFHPIEDLTLTNIECPECGNYLVRREDIILTSNPPQKEYRCLKCGWVGSAFI